MEMYIGAAIMENHVDFLKKIFWVELPYNLAICLLGMCPKEADSLSHKDIYFPVLSVA